MNETDLFSNRRNAAAHFSFHLTMNAFSVFSAAPLRAFLLAALLCCLLAPRSQAASRWLNVNFGNSTNKTGLAATGNDANDLWNLVTAPATVASNYSGTPVITWDSYTNFVWHDNSAAPVELVLTNLTATNTSSHADALLNNWLEEALVLVDDFDGCCNPIVIESDPVIEVRHLPAATNYSLYLYANGDEVDRDGGFRYKVGSGSWSSWKYTTASDPGCCCCCCPPPFSWTEGEHYVAFTNITINAGQSILIELAGNGYDMHMINGLQIQGPVPLPTLPDVDFSPVDGTPVEVNVTLSVSGHNDATIYYTTDGSTPTTSSSVYSSAINLTVATTLKAFAAKSGYNDSAVGSATYPLPTLPDVAFNPADGSTLPATVTLSVTGHTNATIHYTTDGSTPTTNSPVYSSPVALTTGSWSWSADVVPAMTDWTLPAGNTVTNSSVETGSGNHGWKAFDANNAAYWRADSHANQWLSFEFPSSRRVAKYSLRSVDTDGPRDWSFEGWSGAAWDVLDTRAAQTNWYAGELREFVCTNNAAYAKYRLSVSAGNTSAANASGLITVAEIEMFEAYAELNALATQSGYNDSAVGYADYHAGAGDIDPIAPRPTISPASGDQANFVDLAISSALAGAGYQWSTNGTDWNAYSGILSNSMHGTVIAYTAKSGYTDSPRTTNTYTFTADAPRFSPLPGHFVTSVNVSLTNDTENATLHYTTDGSTPTGSSATYSAPIQFTATTTLKAIAVRTGFADSPVSVGVYTLAGANAAPALTVPGAQTIEEDVLSAIEGVSAADADAEPGDLELDLSVTNGFLSVATTNGLEILAGTNGATTNLTLEGRLVELNAALAGLKYQGSNHFNGSDKLTLILEDRGNTGSGGAKSATNTVDITVSAVNDPPAFTLSGNVSVAEDFAGTQTVTVTPAAVPADETGQSVRYYLIPETVSFAAASINSSSGQVSITAAPDGYGTNAFDILAYDGASGAGHHFESFTLEVSAVNDAPVLTLPGSQTTDQETLLNVGGVSVADIDLGASEMEITLVATNGALAVSPTAGLTFTAGTSGSTTNLTFKGSLSDVNAALGGLSYDPQTDFFGDDGIHVSASDLGGSGSGGAQTDVGGIPILVYANGAAPSPMASPAGGAYTAGVSVTLSSALGGATIEYSLDEAASWQNYASPIALAADAALLARTTKYAYYDSPTVTNVYTFTAPLAAIEPDGGRFTNAVTIAITNALAGADLLYSLDFGYTWTEYTNAFTLDGIAAGTGVILARSAKEGFAESTVQSALFTFVTDPPAYSHASGAYTNAVSLTLTTATTGAAIQHSGDAVTWQNYGGALTLKRTQTVYARTTKTGYLASGHVSYRASEGFSPAQGVNAWTYQYSTNLQGSPASFLPFYDADLGVWTRVGDLLTAIGADFQHPGETNDTIRTFTAPNAGAVSILGSALNDDAHAHADGVRARILTNAAAVIDWTALGNNATAALMETNLTLAAGDQIHFQINLNNNYTNDLTLWNPEVAYTHSRAYTFADADGDGLSDLEESAAGTNQNHTDTDGDGVSDWLEILQGRDPLIAGATNDVHQVIGLQVLTPLENLQ